MAAAAGNWVWFLVAWSNFPNNLTQVGYDETTGLCVMSGHIKVNSFVNVMTQINQQNGRLWELRSFIFFIIFFLSLSFFTFMANACSLLFSHVHYKPKAVLWNVMLILCRSQSVLHLRSMNCPRIWIYSTNQQWLRKSPEILPCITFTLTRALLESASEWTYSNFTKNFLYCFIYDKKK